MRPTKMTSRSRLHIVQNNAGNGGAGDGAGPCGSGGARAGTGTRDAAESEVSVSRHTNIL